MRHDTLQKQMKSLQSFVSSKIHSHLERYSKQNSIFEDGLKIIRSRIPAPINFANMLRNSLLHVASTRLAPDQPESKTATTDCFKTILDNILSSNLLDCLLKNLADTISQQSDVFKDKCLLTAAQTLITSRYGMYKPYRMMWVI